ncbi:MAG TPA: hypothetical protein VLE96_06670 [Chlamydiales bacterium]|nr:hypothetical protein [Chlamydiales bacterium]
MIKEAMPVLRALRGLRDFVLLAVFLPALFPALLLDLLLDLFAVFLPALFVDLLLDFFDLLVEDFLRFTIFSSLWSEAKEHPRSTSAYNC